ncbi:NAD(P)-dependent oxidoreductase [Xenorhabdus griffiniae]|uniref:NAD(P)-dependent oxidoreductase n=1 Tax=Xenorhabdus griffiniae TaxID=351672 RepID=A0ABY9XEP6_9GAMM|nr:NAD(P)-dependent oxidoreductase [Xenorhabdus griffiniae]MBD1226037.1 hydroxyacid dehydrogenase [Xenorhabdus griffiniae]MBE8585845.1 hydroxyacid dehydrogenase [Xenorhabdus griffiniae]WMV71392.1 NAD(P)-dependent oxidoreductase [Xenorhabdus griffiniae]WNH01068.1 NAD(P)-dependent oxidoreductase [Xenorhabdus griffiniae]
MKKKIFLLDTLPGELFDKEINGYLSPDIELVINIPVRKDLLCNLVGKKLTTPLQVIGQAGVGLNHIDIQAAESLKIEVINTPGSNATAVAEFTLLQMLALLHRTDWHQRQMRGGSWTKTMRPPSRSLNDISIGLVGSGAISQALLHLLKPFTSQVTILGSPRFTDENAEALGVRRASNIKALVTSNDMISLHLPLTTETHYLINSAILPHFRKGAYLLNTARGGLIDEKALALFMQQNPGWLSGVALDTFENEGEQFSTPIQAFDEALLTPHIAGSTSSAILNAALKVQQAILSKLAIKKA